MSDVRFKTYTMPAGTIGPLNPHPTFPFRPVNEPSPDNVDPSIPPEDAARLGYGRRWTPLPYLLQDDLGRVRRPREFAVAILENDVLRAMFLLELGGRLWSLFHKPTGRELLYVNAVFQPANLAIRHAWFSGGVEWNFGWTGHWPLTCEPLFVARTRLEDGTPGLRLYEFERARAMPFQMDVYLPDGSPVLFVRVTLRNPHRRTIPVYWWSNIAVPERPEGRVLVPTDTLYRFHYETRRLEKGPHPFYEGMDRSRPAHLRHACDNFYAIPSGQVPWIAEVDAAGRGLFQVSTRELLGRKLFVWGQSDRGKKWQKFLNPTGDPYIEIQAGLERTQASSRPLEAGGVLEWLEAYGLVETDPRLAHHSDWSMAWRHVQERMAAQIPVEKLDRELARTRGMADRPPVEVMRSAGGWGALESRRRRQDGDPPLPQAVVFPDDTLGPEQQAWAELLDQGIFPAQDPALPPVSYMVQEEWQRRLERSLHRHSAGDHWAAWLHLGVMHLADGRMEEAGEAWRTSLRKQDNAWAARNLGQLALREGRLQEAVDFYRQARTLAPEDWRLHMEWVRCLLQAGNVEEALMEAERAPTNLRRRGRFRALEIEAAVAAGCLDRAEAQLREPFEIEDAREGETHFAQIWFEYQTKRLARDTGQPITEALREKVRRECPPPVWLDYGM